MALEIKLNEISQVSRYHSLVEPRPKMMVRITVTIMGHEYEREMV
jgi:hypothetical protein